MAVAGNDTIRIIQLVHDTVRTVARDTVLVARAADVRIEPKDWVGWLVTLAGIAVATAVARAGWAQNLKAALASQMASQALKDERDEAIVKEVLLEALWTIPMLLATMKEPLQEGQPVPEYMLKLLDAQMTGWMRNWEKVYLLENRDLRRRVVNWFGEVRSYRVLLSTYVDRDPGQLGPATQGFVLEHLKGYALELDRYIQVSKELFRELGFTAGDTPRPGVDVPMPELEQAKDLERRIAKDTEAGAPSAVQQAPGAGKIGMVG